MFKFILTDNITREKMLDFLRPICRSNKDIGYHSINWVDGVYDSENKIFITQVYCVLDGIARCDVDFYKYIVIEDNSVVFTVTNDYNYITQDYDFCISRNYQKFSEIVKEGLQVYLSRKEHREFEKSLEENNGKNFNYFEHYRNTNDKMNKRLF